MTQRDPLKEIVTRPLEPLPYSSHPSDAILHDYVQGQLRQSGSFDVVGLQAGSLAQWHRAEVTAHLLTCRRCAHLVAELRREHVPSQLKTLLQRLFSRREPVPAFARAVMIAQFVVIVGLIGVIYFKPAPFFSTLNPTASVIPSSEITKTHQPAPQTPHPQGMTLPTLEQSSDDIISQLVESHPLTVHVSFREDTPARELTDLMQRINGILIFVRQSGFVVRLSADEPLESIIQKLSQSPYIIEARKD